MWWWGWWWKNNRNVMVVVFCVTIHEAVLKKKMLSLESMYGRSEVDFFVHGKYIE